MTSTPNIALETPRVDVPGAAARCQMCAHDIAQHDAVGRRYCDATRTSALTRSCLCRV